MTAPPMTDPRAETQFDVLRRRHLMRAGNLVAEPVTQTATTLDVTFDLTEQDADYGVNVTPNWLTTFKVTLKTTTGYRITFGTAAPASATVDTTTFRRG